MIGDLEAVALGLGLAARQAPGVIVKVYFLDQTMIYFVSILLYRNT